MTRINLVPPSALVDKHLVAEYRELPRIFKALYKYPDAPPTNLPDSYRLGTGHVRFFYNKAFWLFDRWTQLRDEMKRRGMEPSAEHCKYVTDLYQDIPLWAHHCANEYRDWQPTPEQVYDNMARLVERRPLPRAAA